MEIGWGLGDTGFTSTSPMTLIKGVHEPSAGELLVDHGRRLQSAPRSLSRSPSSLCFLRLRWGLMRPTGARRAAIRTGNTVTAVACFHLRRASSTSSSLSLSPKGQKKGPGLVSRAKINKRDGIAGRLIKRDLRSVGNRKII